MNSRVNYPIKRVLCRLEESGIIDMSDDQMKFSVSKIVIEVANVGLDRFVSSWNNHAISGNIHVHKYIGETLQKQSLKGGLRVIRK